MPSLPPFYINHPLGQGESCPSAMGSQLYSSSLLAAVRLKSCSRKNFGANMVRSVFTTHERVSSNVSGRYDKPKLDPIRIKSVKEATFKMYPCSVGESEAEEWQDCITAIDETCRRIKRKPKDHTLP